MSRPLLVFLILIAYLALAFGLRTYLHRRRTGSTGFRGISGPPLSPAWLGGVLFVVALAGSVAAPVLVWAGIERVLVASSWLDAAGAAAFVAGAALLLWSQGAMGASWRIGVDAGERTALVTAGPFARVRNPVFSALILSAAGLVLLLPTPTALASVALLVAAIELQVRHVEEPYLTRVHGDAYRRYAGAVGRFVPGLGRLGA